MFAVIQPSNKLGCDNILQVRYLHPVVSAGTGIISIGRWGRYTEVTKIRCSFQSSVVGTETLSLLLLEANEPCAMDFLMNAINRNFLDPRE